METQNASTVQTAVPIRIDGQGMTTAADMLPMSEELRLIRQELSAMKSDLAKVTARWLGRGEKRDDAGELQEANRRLQEEVDLHLKTQRKLSQRQKALEAVYAIATGYRQSLEPMLDEVVSDVQEMLNVAYVSIVQMTEADILYYSQIARGQRDRGGGIPIEEHPCDITAREGRIHQFFGPLGRRYAQCPFIEATQDVSYLGVPLVNSDGTAVGAICAIDTAKRSFSSMDIHLVEIFARYVAHEMGRSLLEGQLRQAQEMRVLGQLTSGVAHEVRNPLNAIQAVTEALFLELGEEKRYDRYMCHINEHVRRLTTLMQDLLELGKTKRHLDVRPVSVSKLAADALVGWRESSRYRCRCVMLDCPEGMETVVRVDAAKIQQVFTNLLDNACQHSPEESQITIRLYPPVNGAVTVAFSDCGSGVADSQIEHVLEPFHTTRRGGTGLGLSIVKHILELHGGNIVLRNNEPPPGLTVECILPVARQERAES